MVVLNLKNVAWLRVSGASGIITPMVLVACVLLATAYSHRFSWTENALSDLGVQGGAVAVQFRSNTWRDLDVCICFRAVLLVEDGFG